MAYRRDVFNRAGLFDERFDACEDCELNHRLDEAGLQCVLVPTLAVKYEPRKTVRGLFRQLFRYGRGRVRLARKHPETITLGSFVPAAFVLGLLAGPLVCAVVPPLWSVYVATIALYLVMVILTGSVIAWQQRQPALAILLPVVLATIHLGSGVGILVEACRRLPAEKQPVREPPAPQFSLHSDCTV